MESKDDRGLFWLHLICCGGPLIIIGIVTLVPLLVTFVLTYKVWVLVAGVGVALGTALIWWRRRQRTVLMASLDRGEGVTQVDQTCAPVWALKEKESA